MKKGLKLLSFITILALIMVGCGEVQQPQTQTQSYQNDGYLGFTNANPNLHTSPTYHNRSKDQQMVRKALAGIKQVKSSRTFFNGSNAHVTIRVSKGLTTKQQSEVRADAYEAVQMMLPRYIVTVTLEEENA